MPRSTLTEQRTIERFRPRYRQRATDAERAIERAAIGGNVGANGYTTVAQADRMGRLLALGPGKALLDIGCGRGYPALYLAEKTGCRAVGVDLPVESLHAGLRRSRRQRIAGRTDLAAAS